MSARDSYVDKLHYLGAHMAAPITPREAKRRDVARAEIHHLIATRTTVAYQEAS